MRTCLPAFDGLFQGLNARLPAKLESSSTSSTGPSVPAGALWANEFLLGVVAECELGFHDSVTPGGDEGTDPGKSTKEAPAPNRKDRTQRAARQALEHYNKFIVTRPGSYWGHFLAAAVSYGLGGGENLAAAASHLDQCLQQRPNNPMLHSHLAATLMVLDRHREAQREIEIAIEKMPIWPSFTAPAPRLRTTLGQTVGPAEDLEHFELLEKHFAAHGLGSTPSEFRRV